MTIPQLFYLGIFAGLLHRIPGMDLGTLFFALYLNEDFFSSSFKKALITIGIASLGFLTTLIIPLYRIDPFLYFFSEKILGFFFGFVFYAILTMAYKINLGEKKGIFIVTCIVLILTILLKSFMTKWNVHENSKYAFIQNFLIFIPGLRLNPMTLSTVGDFISGALGILASMYLLVLLQKSVLYKNYIIVSLITASLVDFWPWRSFQNISYSLEGSARWIKDYPVMPYSDSQNVVLTVIFFLMGILSSWILIKIHNQRIILVHE